MIARLLLLLAAALLATAAVDPNDPFGAAMIDERPGAQVPLDEPFVASTGRVTTLRAIADGRPLLLVPVQHDCPNICGVTLAGLADAVDGQDRFRPARDFAIVAFGIDPREGPQSARAELERFARQRQSAADWRPVALTGGAGAIRRVTRALGYRYAWDERLGQYAHLSATAVLTPDGRLSSWLYGIRPTSTELERALAQAQTNATGEIMQRLLLLCFHYDPQTGRYSLAITRALRWAGVLTLAALGLLLLGLARRRSRAG